MTRIVLASAMLLLVLCSRANAQSSPWQREERTSGGWTFTPGTAAGVLRDSGLQSGGDSSLFKSWVGTASPQAELDYNGRLSHASFGYASMLEKYWGAGTRWDQYAHAGVRRAMSPHVNVAGNFSFARVPTTDRLESADSQPFALGVLPFADVHAQTITTSGDVSWRASARTNLFASYQFQRLTLDKGAIGGFGALHDGYSHTPSVGFTRDFTSRLSVGATAAYSREYVDEGFNQFDVRSLTGEFVYRWSPVLSISGGGGASVVETLVTGEQATSPTFHGGFTRTMRVWTLAAGYERSVQQLFGFGTLAPTHVVTGDAFIPFANRLYYLDATVAYGKTGTFSDLPLGFNLSTLWTNVSIGRQLAPRLRAEAFVGVARQASQGFDTANRTRVGIQIVTSKPLRIQ